MADKTPKLQGQAAEAVAYRDGHLQIIAAAGSGKTEVVSQRVAGLLADGFAPSSIVAFTFTERAAASLKSRIEKRAAELLGAEFLDRLNGMFVGTIHSYCFQLLQQHVPRYETFDVLDDHRLTAFLTREAWNLDLKSLEGTLFKSIRAFLVNLQVVENELLEPEDLEDPFREVYESYRTRLDENRFLTYGQIIARAVEELNLPDIFTSVHDPLRHLIVDEYQDVNPAQEELIERLAGPPVHLCVVGDDDQSIYQWRGSDVDNIIGFHDRYDSVRSFRIEQNRRSRPQIIDLANDFAKSIENRLPKKMRKDRTASAVSETVCWSVETEPEQADAIAAAIKSAHDDLSYSYRDIAILCRGRVSMPPILDALEQQGVPVQPGGRTNLFLRPEAELFGRTLCWLVDFDWRIGEWGWNTVPVELKDLLAEHTAIYTLSAQQRRVVEKQLLAWKERRDQTGQPANLVREFYDLLLVLKVEEWDLTNAWTVNRLGTLARCSQLLVDYETARRRSHPDHKNPGQMKTGIDRGKKYYEWLAIYVQNWATGTYEDFEGEEDIELDAVDLTTVHQAKGLEWPIVFVPSLKSDRFPSSKTGRRQNWHVPLNAFKQQRYEGSTNDERRLFYVAMTRARDFLSLSTFNRINRATKPSPFLVAASGGSLPSPVGRLQPPPPEVRSDDEEVLEVTFSDLATYLECGLSFRLRRNLGFQPPLAPELGYGKAVHHVLRRVAEHVKRFGKKPTPKQLDRLFDEDFYLPAANRAAHDQFEETWPDPRRQVSRGMGVRAPPGVGGGASFRAPPWERYGHRTC